jgi:Acetyltransferases
MAVLPEYRGRGIGTLLLRTLMQSLKDQGIGAVSLSVDVRNPARRLYERFGFYEIDLTGRSMTMRADLTDGGAGRE